MTAPRPFDLVIFDLDGTLVDSLPDIAWALNATLVAAGLPAFPMPTVAQFVGDGAARLIERALSAAAGSTEAGGPEAPESAIAPSSTVLHLERQPAALLSHFVSTYAGRVCADSRLYPGISDLLEGLSSAGVATAVITNKPGHLARSLLGALGIAAFFTTAIGDLDGFPRKPAPDSARAAIQRAGTTAERTVVVGDGLPDMRVARAVPCAAIAAGWGYVPLDRLAEEQPRYLAASVANAARILLPTAGLL